MVVCPAADVEWGRESSRASCADALLRLIAGDEEGLGGRTATLFNILGLGEGVTTSESEASITPPSWRTRLAWDNT